MPGSTTLCDKILSSGIDNEDINYLQKGLFSLLTESKQPDINKFLWSKQCNNSSVLLSSQVISEQHNWSLEGHFWTGARNGNNIAKSSNDSDSDYSSAFSPEPLKQHHDTKTLFNAIVNKGVDNEDFNFLKRSFNCLLWDVNQRNWTNKVFWDTHPPTSDDIALIINSVTNYPLNKTGSARSEGFFKLGKFSQPKMKYTRKQLDISEVSDDMKTLYGKSYKGNKQTLSRDARNDQRRLFTAYQTITDSDLLKLNELKFRKKKLRLGKSEIHGLGLFACELIAPNEIIIEYVGQIIRPIIADLRENVYKSSGIGSYCFRIDEDTIVDATKHGNLNRYINHSCNPNSYAKILLINNQKKIVIYSKKSIKIDEEITYDYKMPFEDDKIECLCRALGCRKSLN